MEVAHRTETGSGIYPEDLLYRRFVLDILVMPCVKCCFVLEHTPTGVLLYADRGHAGQLTCGRDMHISLVPDIHQREFPYTLALCPMPTPYVPSFAQMPFHMSWLVPEGQHTFRIDASRHTQRLARGAAPSNPEKAKGSKGMKRSKPVRTTAVMVRMFPEERDLLRTSAIIHGMTMSDYIRQTCLGIRLRRTPEEKRRLRELARIGSNINQLARWANTCKRAAEAVEVLTALASLERGIAAFMAVEGNTGEEANEQQTQENTYGR